MASVSNSPLAVGPQGLGGWLILPLLGLIVSLLRQISTLPSILVNFKSDTWTALTSTQSHVYHPYWAPLLIFELIINVGFIAFEVVILVAFLKRKRILPSLVVAWLGLLFVTTAADLIFSSAIPFIASQPNDGSDSQALARTIVGCAIWIPYFYRSQRVKATFVN